MKIIISLIGLISLESYFAQNLIPNPSFEDTVLNCNYQIWVDPGMPHIGLATGWYMPTKGTPDLKAPTNICPYTGYDFGLGYSVTPSHGLRCAAFITYGMNAGSENYREYIGIKLTQALNKDKAYCLSFDVVLMEGSHYATNNFGILISEDSINENILTDLNIVPTINIDTPYTNTNWSRLSMIFTAEGQEEFIYFGNFFADSLTQTFTMSENYPFTFFCIDNLSLTLCPGQEPEEHFSLYPNPSNGNALYIDKYADTTANIYLYNSIGQQVGTKELPTGAYQGAVFEHIAAGVYILIYETAEGYYEERKVVVVK